MTQLLFLLVVLICPLSMMFMMRGMHGDHGGHHTGPPRTVVDTAAGEARIAALEHEVASLRGDMTARADDRTLVRR